MNKHHPSFDFSSANVDTSTRYTMKCIKTYGINMPSAQIEMYRINFTICILLSGSSGLIVTTTVLHKGQSIEDFLYSIDFIVCDTKQFEHMVCPHFKVEARFLKLSSKQTGHSSSIDIFHTLIIAVCVNPLNHIKILSINNNNDQNIG
jgi:hypothetical protein